MPVTLKDMFHPACRAPVSLGWPLFIAMAMKMAAKQRPTKRRHVQGMLGEIDPLSSVCARAIVTV